MFAKKQMSQNARINELAKLVNGLTDYQLQLVKSLLDQFGKEFLILERNNTSDFIDECFLQNFGDVLRLHHCFSREPFTKDKFEHALNRTLQFCGVKSDLADRGNPGFDIVINNVPVSLKTQADRSIRDHKIHISKFMELGKGEWSDKIEDLIGLRTQFITHLNGYDRIFTLRCLSKFPNPWKYELVEIPKELLLDSINGEFEIKHNSKQNPKPGYCRVFDQNGNKKFELYFDGGGERKLQIKHLSKSYCKVHATWQFEQIEQI